MFTEIKFLEDLPLYEEETPFELYSYNYPDPASSVTTNCQFKTFGVEVSDTRDTEDLFTLENVGFQYVQHKSALTLVTENFENETENEVFIRSYLRETTQLVKNMTNADNVIVFDWRVNVKFLQSVHCCFLTCY
jgi:hypothetical protein